MIGSGHMIDYIKRYVDFYLCSPPVITHLTILFLLLPMNRHGNSYNFSQQGWEALNQKIKQFYLKNTNHGGFTGKGETATIGEHMMPIMRMFQRFIMWKSGLGQAYFMAEDQVEFEEERSSLKKNGRVYCARFSPQQQTFESRRAYIWDLWLYLGVLFAGVTQQLYPRLYPPIS